MTAENAAPPHTSLTDWIWLSLPYLLLVATAGYVLLTGAMSPGDARLAVAVGVTLVLWHTFWTVLNRQWLERTLVPMAVYYLGLIVLCTLLVRISFSFFAVYLVCYPMAFVALPGLWSYAGLALTTLTPLFIPGMLSGTGLNMAITGAGLALTAFIGWSIRRLEAETAARKAALLELTAAHTELERALAENIRLQDRLVSEAHEAGVATERARLAAEIHDTLAAALTGIVSQLEALDAEIDPGDPVRPRLRASTEVARESLQEARHSIQALRPTPLHGRSLARALAEVIRAVERTHGVPVRLHLTGTPFVLEAEVEDALVRIAREALTNASRHAGAHEAHLTLSYLDETVALDVADDGAGFDAGSPRPSGHGLAIMSERAEALGGHLDLRTGPGAGTTLTVTVPVPSSPLREPGLSADRGRRARPSAPPAERAREDVDEHG